MKLYSKEEQKHGVQGWWNCDQIVKWDDEYDNYDVHTMRYLNARQKTMLKMLDSLNLPKGSKVLELGYGAGQTASKLVSRGFHVTGIDISAKLCEISKIRCQRENPDGVFDMRVGSIEERYDFEDNSFDVVVQMGAMQYLHDPNECLKEVYRVLKPGGYFLVGQRNAYCISHLSSLRDNVRNWIYFLCREKYEIESCFKTILTDSKLGKFFKKYENSKFFNSKFMMKGHIHMHYKMHKNIYTESILVKQVRTHGFNVLKRDGAYLPFSEKKRFWDFNLKYDDFWTGIKNVPLFHFLYKFGKTIVLLTQKPEQEDGK